MWGLYKTQPAWVLGFHGCDEDLGLAVLAGEKHLDQSRNAYDWLGNGIYFWEGSPQRAEEWAQAVHRRRPSVIRKPFVVGAIIDLGNCCNLTDRSASDEVADAFAVMKDAYEIAGLTLRDNEGGTHERLMRYRDRAVLEFMHSLREDQKLAFYDTVRSPFLEGEPLFEAAGLRKMTHIQIAVRNTACIKGYFRPIPDS